MSSKKKSWASFKCCLWSGNFEWHNRLSILDYRSVPPFCLSTLLTTLIYFSLPFCLPIFFFFYFSWFFEKKWSSKVHPTLHDPRKVQSNSYSVFLRRKRWFKQNKICVLISRRSTLSRIILIKMMKKGILKGNITKVIGIVDLNRSRYGRQWNTSEKKARDRM